MTQRQTNTDGPTATRRQGFNPAARRRNRIAAGVALAAVAIGGNLAVYSGLQTSDPAVQVTADVPAGVQITSDMVREVDVDADASVNLVPGSEMPALVGQYAKVRLVSGSLITFESVQSAPLVTPGNAVVAIEVKEGALPVGLRERVPVRLVLPVSTSTTGIGPPVVIDGVVVALPITPTNGIGTQSLSVEVAAADGPTVAAADNVRVVLTEPIIGATAIGPTGTDADSNTSDGTKAGD